MKKRIVFAIIAFVHAFSLCAQQDTTSLASDEARDSARVSRLHFAATVGVGFSNVRAKSNSKVVSDFLIGKKPTVNYRVGALLDIDLVDKLFLETSVLFLHKGYRIVNELGGENEEDYTIRLYYLHIPVTANYKFPIEKVWLAPQLGPYFDIALFGRQKGFERNNHVKKIYNEDIFETHSDSYRRFDCGIQVGLNAFYKCYRAGMELDLGIVNMYKKVLGTQPEIRHHAFTFNFAYYFK